MPDLEIKEHFGQNNDRVELTLWIKKEPAETSTNLENGRVKSRVKIKEEMRNIPTISLKEIAERLNLSIKTVEKAVSKMTEDGEIAHNGPKKSGYWEILK